MAGAGDRWCVLLALASNVPQSRARRAERGHGMWKRGACKVALSPSLVLSLSCWGGQGEWRGLCRAVHSCSESFPAESTGPVHSEGPVLRETGNFGFCMKSLSSEMLASSNSFKHRIG